MGKTGVKEAARVKEPKERKPLSESAFIRYFRDIGTAVSKGDAAVKLSMLIMGAGFIARKQVIKGILVTLVEALYILLLAVWAIPNLSKFSTLGTVQLQMVFDPATGKNVVNDYDNSFLILIFSIVALVLLAVFVLYYIHNLKAVYKIQLRAEQGRHINTFKEDLKSMVGDKFHITLLTLPSLGVILMNVLPLFVLVAIAFTNYDQQHMPPNALLDWVGFDNFKTLFSRGGLTVSFGYAFGKIVSWTFLWAFLATFTCFIGGILLAQLINSQGVKFKKMWRTLFIVTIAVPQFVTLLLVRNFFREDGIVNTLAANSGLIDFLKNIGLVKSSMNAIPFLSGRSVGWAKFMIVMINIWVGVPYQMLIATGVLMNAPQDQVESARIDGANKWQIFWKITMPYILVVQGPALITDFVRNINNFNVIYLLTQDLYTTQDMAMANSNAKEVDLLVTWLFRLTNEYYNYKMASVIGIIVFLICVAFTLVSYARMMRGGREEDYQL